MKSIVPSTASQRFSWPSIRLCQVGELASSKSAMKTLAPEFKALMIIFRSVGPVISTRRSCKVGGNRRHRPVALADGLGLGKEVGELAGVEFPLAARPCVKAATWRCSSNSLRRASTKCKASASSNSASGPTRGPRISSEIVPDCIWLMTFVPVVSHPTPLTTRELFRQRSRSQRPFVRLQTGTREVWRRGPHWANARGISVGDAAAFSVGESG